MTKIHMIRSVKGGSGKTAFALHRLVEFAYQGKKTVFLDADVHASETLNSVCGEFNHEMINKVLGDEQGQALVLVDKGSNRKGHYLNSFVHPYKGYYSKFEEILHEKRLCFVERNDLRDLNQGDDSVQFIFCDPSIEGRAVFGNIFQSSGRSAVGVGAYIAKIKLLLQYLLDKNAGYDEIIVDMPPGTDAFSEHIADLLIHTAGEDHELSVYYVSSDDVAHLKTSLQAALSHLSAMRSSYIRHIYYVYNVGREKREKSDEGETEPIKSRADIITKLKTLTLVTDETDLNELEILLLNHDALYYKTTKEQCISLFSVPGNAIDSANIRVEFVVPLK